MRATGDAAGSRPGLAFAYDPVQARRVFSDDDLATLAGCSRVIDSRPLETFDEARARAVLAETEILVTGWGCPRIDHPVLLAAPKLRLIAHAAGTVKFFIAPEVYEAGVTVVNAADANALPVAEYTLAAILFANKRVLEFRALCRETRGDVSTHPMMHADVGNWKKTVGIIGASRIGLRVIELLRPFDLTVLLYDPYAGASQVAAIGAELVPLDDLFARSDVVSLHAPALDSTRHMIDARRLALLRDGGTFINTARGSLVDHAALESELVSGRISAVIDVTPPEVLPATSPLYDLPNVLLTPHIAGAIGTERERLGAVALAEVQRYIAGEPLRHVIDPDGLERQA